jgi:vancomycin resistance protein YoaR
MLDSRMMLGLRKRTLGTIFVILFGQIVVSILIGTLMSYGTGHSKAPKGLNIWGNDLSGMTENEAFRVLYEEIPKSVVYKDETYSLDITETRKELEGWITKQYSVATGNWIIDSFEYLQHLLQTPDSPQRVNPHEILPQVQKLGEVINREGKPANLYYQNGELTLVEGVIGQKLNVDESWNALYQGRGNFPVPLSVNSIEVHPTTADLQQVKDTLGDYTTYFNPDLKERVNNVQLAAKAFDGLIIPPGGEFSFNKTVGKRERETGYLPAFMFTDNKVVLDDGGGVCQDSSTLFHAVRQANLKILERNSHSLPVSYVPRGKDATVAFGLLDFRFKNDTQGYLLISARTGKDWIRVRLFGVSDAKHPVLEAPDGYPFKPQDWILDPK